MSPFANNMTVTIGFSSCDNTTWNLTRTLSDLRDLYQNTISNLTSNGSWNISISNFNCSNTESYFQQIISFTQAVSIRIQILFASVYFDYLQTNKLQFNGLMINPESLMKLSSITVNNSDTSNACSSAEIAQDLLCPTNQTNSLCTRLANPWNFACRRPIATTVTSLFSSTSQTETVVISTGLNSWQLGLIGTLSVLFALFLLLFISGFVYRRFKYSKKIALSQINLSSIKSIETNGIPHGQAFQQVATVLQPNRINHTATSWLHDGTAKNGVLHDVNYKHSETLGLYNPVTFVDHAKIYDPAFPPHILPISKTPVAISTSSSDRTESTLLSRPVSRTSLNQLQSITDSLHEKKANESISNSPKNPSTPTSRQFTNLSSIDENLTDEDAWMSILDVVNAELAILEEQDRTRTVM